MRLTGEQLLAIQTRNDEVINGFKLVRNQQARDVKTLLDEVRVQQNIIIAMQRRMLADELVAAAKSARGRAPLQSFFDSLGI